MPGIKRARPKSSYFSGTSLDLSWTFSRSKSVSRQRERSKSIEFLASPQLDSSRRAQSSRDISSDYEREQIELNKLQIERELELKVQSLGNLLDENSKKYKEVTVPVTIKFSVYEDSDKKQSRMARSRSPSSSFSNTELLDQTLINIRKKLNELSNNRVEMESKMDELITGIKSVHLHCQNYAKAHSPPVSQMLAIRRVHSSHARSKRSVNMSPTGRGHNLSPTGRGYNANETSSPDYFIESPDLSQETNSTLSASSQGSGSGSLQMRNRSKSSAASFESKICKPLTFISSPVLGAGGEGSASQEDVWMPSGAIPELPESPRLSISSNSITNSSSSLQNCAEHTAVPSNLYRRSYSTTTPPLSISSFNDPSIITSTPNVSTHQSPPNHYFHTMPAPSHHRSSLPESILRAIIHEDQVDNSNCSDNFSCTDEGSPKSAGNGNTIVRRSSLTGQLELDRNPRLSNGKLYPQKELKRNTSSSSWNAPMGNNQDFKVLNKGVRKSTRKRKVILPSIETTV